MKYKVVYITIIILLTFLGEGLSQKSSLILLPSGRLEGRTQEVQTNETNTIKKTSEFKNTDTLIQNTPDINKHEKNSNAKNKKLCKIIGSICTKKWSEGIIRLFQLPSASGITI